MTTQLPGIAGEIEAIIGMEATVRLLKERGGTEITIPKSAKDTVLAGIIGEFACEKLRDELGAGPVTLPCGQMRGRDAERNRKKREAMKLLRAGQSCQQVALACDLHLRTVSRYAAELMSPDDQLSLPL